MKTTDTPPLLHPREAQKELEKVGIKMTTTTILNWCRTRGWGFKLPSGRWMVLRPKVEELIHAAKQAARQANGS